MPQDVMELLACWKGALGRSRRLVFWQVIPHCLFWCLWWEQNARCFEGREQHPLAPKWTVLRTLMELVTAIGLFSFTTILDLIDICTA